jgi:hypothetical protein
VSPTIAPVRISVRPDGPPPAFRIGGVSLHDVWVTVEVAATRALFEPGNAGRRTADNFTSERFAVPQETGVYTLSPRAWTRLSRGSALFYRVLDDASRGSAPNAAAASASPVVLGRLRVRPPPSAALSGELTWLRVRDNMIVDGSDDPVVLRGVEVTDTPGRQLRDGPADSRPGLWPADGAISGQAEAVAGVGSTYSGATLVRIPLSEGAILRSAQFRDKYLRAVDELIRQAAGNGSYTLLTLRWLDGAGTYGADPDGGQAFLPPLPDAATTRAWRLLAHRYANEPAVLFDLWDRPHPSPPAAGARDRWHIAVRGLEAAIAREHGRALLFVAGPRFGRELGSFPVLDADRPLRNVVYRVRVPGPAIAAPPAGFEALLAPTELRALCPVFVDWSAAGASLEHVDRFERFLRPLHRHREGRWQGLAGWSLTYEARLVEFARATLATAPSHPVSDFDPAAADGHRDRWQVRPQPDVYEGDLFAIEGHDFVPRRREAAPRIEFSRAGAAEVSVEPAAVLPHALIVAALPATLTAGDYTMTVVRARGAPSRPVNITIRPGQRPEGVQVVFPGAQKPSGRAPYTIAMVASVVAEHVPAGGGTSTTVRDGLGDSRTAFNTGVAHALRTLFALPEGLLRPYAEEIRVVVRYARDLTPYVQFRYDHPARPRPDARAEGTLEVQHDLGRALIATADIAFFLTNGRDDCRASSASYGIDGRVPPALPFWYDDRVGLEHRHATSVPSLSALYAPPIAENSRTALHEFAHGASDAFAGAVGDLYHTDYGARSSYQVNKKWHGDNVSIPDLFASLQLGREAAPATASGQVARLLGMPRELELYRSDAPDPSTGYAGRAYLGYPPSGQGQLVAYGPELIERTEPNLMDEGSLALVVSQQPRQRLDRLTLRYLRDRIEWKLGR